MLLNVILVLLILLALVAYLLYKFMNPAASAASLGRKNDSVDKRKYTLKEMTSFLKKTINEMTGSDLYDLALDQEDFERRQRKRAELKSALKGSTSGNIYDKMYVKQFMFDIYHQMYGLNESNINLVLPFEQEEQLTRQDKFEILLHIFKKNHGYKALPALIDKYGLDKQKQLIENGDTPSYLITGAEIDAIYTREQLPLSFEDKLQIVVQRIYQSYKGFGVVDEIRDMSIDGVSGGVSGLPEALSDAEEEAQLHQAMRHLPADGNHSVWIMYKGKTLHLSFLSFGSQLELKRVCQNLYKYNNPGQLTETNGFIVNELKDGSRIVVMRPPFAESWVFFNRKFDLTYTSLEHFLDPPNRGARFANSELPIELLPFLMKGARVTAITGDQGTGKSTLMMAMMRYIYGWLTLRVQEMSFELHLRKLYPQRNIVTTRQTDSISGQKGMDVQKKSDGAVNIIGEVATDEQASWMIQAAQVASLFTVFSHHAKTFFQLIFSIRNSMVKSGMFRNEAIAEQQVVDVIHFDVHLNKDADGRRYIERITECIPMLESSEYPDDLSSATIEYYRRTTDKRSFMAVDIVKFADGAYVAGDMISAKNREEMKKYMTPQDRDLFDQFLQKHWTVNAE
ncbi:pilus assembly protein CpaF [Paenibacillus harenae]|uniref:Pilus assembly protein CpaF n=1 Tax=Paenibacillus harenae TaxID=306543 RepID=A0ABT9TTJ3_PAEHA|nr:pilus assembly protein CpaF [Paenibacillus harenae]MDQ0110656.1 pilus assembly protein CpaF [Paenibacillus harenae]